VLEHATAAASAGRARPIVLDSQDRHPQYMLARQQFDFKVGTCVRAYVYACGVHACVRVCLWSACVRTCMPVECMRAYVYACGVHACVRVCLWSACVRTCMPVERMRAC